MQEIFRLDSIPLSFPPDFQTNHQTCSWPYIPSRPQCGMPSLKDLFTLAQSKFLLSSLLQRHQKSSKTRELRKPGRKDSARSRSSAHSAQIELGCTLCRTPRCPATTGDLGTPFPSATCYHYRRSWATGNVQPPVTLSRRRTIQGPPAAVQTRAELGLRIIALLGPTWVQATANQT